MSTLKNLIGRSLAPWREVVVRTSRTFIAPVSGWYLVVAVGGGGSGGIAGNSTGAAASGGSAGHREAKLIFLTAGQTLVINIGAGALGVSGLGVVTAGNDGGDTTVVGPGISLTAGGGKAGNAASGSGATAAAAAASTGDGGDLSLEGGRSGDATITGTSHFAATGGGAVAIRDLGHPSGAADVPSGSNNAAASGGAGIGGKSGDVSNTTTSASKTLGGSPVGESADQAGTGTGDPAPSVFDADASIDPFILGTSILDLVGRTAFAKSPGWGTDANNSGNSNDAGLFSGSGASGGTSGARSSGRGGDFGGASGGVSGNSSQLDSGDAGVGGVVIQLAMEA